MTNDNTESMFQQSWSVYDAIIHTNYMKHIELVAAIQATLGHQSTSSLHVLDLGCGDGWISRKSFAGYDVAEYTGVDLSQAALDSLRHHPEYKSLPGKLICGDIAAVLSDVESNSIDVILASYSLHHFDTKNKESVLADIDRILKPGGRFFWVDIYLRPSETRDEYITRLTDQIRNHWTDLPTEYRAKVCAHVTEYDFPETVEWTRSQFASRGAWRFETLYSDDYFGMWLLEKDPA